MRSLIVGLFLVILTSVSSYAQISKEYINACSNGDMRGCYNVGLEYINKDLLIAREYLSLACKKKIEEACNKLKILDVKEKKIEKIPSKLLQNESKKSRFFVDIDNDRKKEIITWQKFFTSERGDFYQLLVFDDDGSILWKAPSTIDDTNPFAFYSLDTGESLPQLLVDFDLDGYIELLAPMAQSDVSPRYYRKLRWKGNRFEVLLQNALILKNGSSSKFVWKTVLKSEGVWVSKLSMTADGKVKAEITGMNSKGEVSMGEVLIRFVKGGAVIDHILKPMAIESRKDSKSLNSKVWTGHYKNSQLGFSFDYPENIFTQKRLYKREGITLKGQKGLEFQAFAAVYDQLINDVYYEILAAEIEDGSQIIYKTIHRDWYVISGIYKDRQTLFYKKAFFDDNFGIYMEFKYYVRDKSMYDPLVTQMMKSVKIFKR